MTRLEITQKLLGPVLNFIIERVFPKGAFYGVDYLKIFDETRWESMGPTAGAAFFIIGSIKDTNATNAKFKFSGVTFNGVNVGDWTMTIEKTNIKGESNNDKT